MITPSLARTGTVSAEPEDRVLVAGPVEVRLQGCALHSVRFRRRQMLGSLAFLVRDRSWGTVAAEFEQVAQEIRPDGFMLSFECRARGDGIDLSWETRIEAKAEGTLTLTVRGRANGPTTTNRAGLVALHPTEWAGAKVEVDHPDGKQTVGVLPRDVDPEPCFSDIAALRLSQRDAWVDLRFAGGTWEMEDQRNWLDASFKTYFRPMSLPYPYDISGEFLQSVTVAFGCEETTAAAPRSSTEAMIDVGAATAAIVPRIGLRSDGRYGAEELANLAAFEQLAPFALHASLDLRSPGWRDRVADVAVLSGRLAKQVSLEIIPDVGDTSVRLFDEVAGALRETTIGVESVLISLPETVVRLDPGPPDPPEALLLSVHQQARQVFPDVLIGGGTLGLFAELNRNWPPLGLIDFVAHTSSSIVHAADSATLVENLSSYADIARTVRAASGPLPHRWISATIGLPDNPYNRPSRVPSAGQLAPMQEFDPRHGALFGAAWTLASFAALAKANAAEVVPASLCGPMGLVSTRLKAPQPWYDGQARSRLYPLYHVVRGLARLSGAALMSIETGNPAVHAIACAARDGSCELWLANVCTQAVSVEIMHAETIRAATLDERTFEQASTMPDYLEKTVVATTSRLELRPYATSHVTFVRRS